MRRAEPRASWQRFIARRGVALIAGHGVGARLGCGCLLSHRQTLRPAYGAVAVAMTRRVRSVTMGARRASLRNEISAGSSPGSSAAASAHIARSLSRQDE